MTYRIVLTQLSIYPKRYKHIYWGIIQLIMIIIVFQMFNVQFPIALPNTPHSTRVFIGVCPLAFHMAFPALFLVLVVLTWAGVIYLSGYYICVSATVF